MSTPTYPMRRALHLRLEADLDDLEVAALLHGVPVDRLHCFELGEIELAPHELSELADQLALVSSWRGEPRELRELVGPDGTPYDLRVDAALLVDVVRQALTAELERRLAVAAEVRDLKDALPPAADARWAPIASLWRPLGGREVVEEVASQVARDTEGDVERFLRDLTKALNARRAN